MRSAVDNLNDSTVIRVLQEFSEDFGKPVVDDQDTALEVVDSLLSRAGDDGIGWVLASESNAIAAGRFLIEGLAEEPATAVIVAAILDDPPHDNRLILDSVVASAAVLGAVITWLQTRVDLTVRRKDGKTEVEFKVQKRQASDSLLKALADTLRSMLSGPDGPDRG